MGFIKAILIFLLIYFLLRILARWFAPMIFQYAARKTEAHFREQFGMMFGGKDQKEVAGDGPFSRKSRDNKKESDKVGEYIEFEEIE